MLDRFLYPALTIRYNRNEQNNQSAAGVPDDSITFTANPSTMSSRKYLFAIDEDKIGPAAVVPLPFALKLFVILSQDAYPHGADAAHRFFVFHLSLVCCYRERHCLHLL